MKKLIDGTEVSIRSYYYLLDWNEVDEHKKIYASFGKMKLNELVLSEYQLLFTFATNHEFDSLTN